jgi:formylglycine-generating enzyme required for sulfatase activity
MERAELLATQPTIRLPLAHLVSALTPSLPPWLIANGAHLDGDPSRSSPVQAWRARVSSHIPGTATCPFAPHPSGILDLLLEDGMLGVRSSLAAAAVALAFVGLVPAPARAAQPQLVVLKFTGKGFADPVIVSATSAAESAALEVSGGRFKVVTRDMLAAVVGEEKLLKCEEEARCELDLGVGLGTGYMLAGSFLRIGTKAEVTVKLYDVRKLDLLAQMKDSAARDEELLDHIGPLVERVLRKGLGDREPIGDPKLNPFAATPVNRKEDSPSTEPTRAAPARGAVSRAVSGMVQLEGGSFSMASRGTAVTVQPFLLDVTPVKVGAYQECVKAGKCSTESLNSSSFGSHSYCNWGKANRANHPINCLDWNQARTYCAAVGKRLPTVEELEWAARGAERGTTYPWGNESPSNQLCWNGGSVQRSVKKLGTCTVGSFPAGDSPQGLKDLAGNVWEWTSSEYDSSNYVVHGGCWYDDTPRSGVAAAGAYAYPTTHHGESIGFRCARTP